MWPVRMWPLIWGLLLLVCHARRTPDMKTDDPFTVHIVFANHLDIGFGFAHVHTELAFDNTVINVYLREHLPRAVYMANRMRELSDTDRYIYTAPSYIVNLFLDCPAGLDLECPDPHVVEEFKAAVERGDIVWHAFPHNAQLEFADPSLVGFGFDLTHDLDRRFNKTPTISMSQRDVPGTTRSIIPIMVEKGIQSLSVGVNAGAAPPGVPKNTPFIWKDPVSGAQILAYWHAGGYGGYTRGLPMSSRPDCVMAEGFNHALCVAWREDNDGPPFVVEEILEDFAIARESFPGAVVIGSTLDDFTRELMKVAPQLNLPVVTGEIGDTWLYGAASDPRKGADFRAALRARRRCISNGDCNLKDYNFFNFSRILLKIPEHTWGVDMGKSLGDWVNWTNAGFHQCLQDNLPNYQRTVFAWERQLRYVQWAIEALPADHPLVKYYEDDKKVRQESALVNDDQLRTDLKANLVEVTPGQRYDFSTESWDISIDSNRGSISQLRYRWPRDPASGNDWAAGESLFGQLMYSVYNDESFDWMWRNYLNTPFKWWDFAKYNLSMSGWQTQADVPAHLEAIYDNKDSSGDLVLHLRYNFPQWFTDEAGAPPTMWVVLRVPNKGKAISVWTVWQNKPPTRVPEAVWFRFKPDAGVVDTSSWKMNKLGADVGPLEVMLNGSYSQHAVQDEGVSVMGSGDHAWEKLHIGTLDAGVVSPGHPWPLPNPNHIPDMTEGMSFNLYNNMWGTNYIMWFPYNQERDQNMTFRFTLEVEDTRVAPSIVSRLKRIVQW